MCPGLLWQSRCWSLGDIVALSCRALVTFQRWIWAMTCHYVCVWPPTPGPRSAHCAGRRIYGALETQRRCPSARPPSPFAEENWIPPRRQSDLCFCTYFPARSWSPTTFTVLSECVTSRAKHLKRVWCSQGTWELTFADAAVGSSWRRTLAHSQMGCPCSDRPRASSLLSRGLRADPTHVHV